MSAIGDVLRRGRTVPSRVRHALPRLLRREEWTYILSLMLPLLVADVAMSIIRVRTQYNPPAFMGFLDQIRSDVLINLGFMALWVALFAKVRHGWGRTLVLAAFHLSVTVYALFAVLAHAYYLKTGSFLDASTVILGVESFEEIQVVIASETTSAYWVGLALLAAYGLFGPGLVTRALHGRLLPHLLGSEPAPARRQRRAAAAGLVAFALIGLSAMPGFTAAGMFARNRAVAMAFDLLSPSASNGDTLVPAEGAVDAPTDAYLTGGDGEQRNVVMIFMESVRANATTLDDPDARTTPYLAELAETSLSAEQGYAVLPHTSKSITAGNCGVEPPLDTMMTESEPDAIPSTCLPDLLSAEGYRSAWFQSAVGEFERRADLVENFGYDEFHPVNDLPKEGFGRANYFGYEDDIMLEPTKEWVEQSDDPFLLSYLTVSSHHDYVIEDWEQEHLSDDPSYNDYLNTLRYQDQFVKKVIDQFKEMGLYEDTVFVLTADHGEGFGEHGLYQHDNTIYNEGTKIPIMVHDPQRIDEIGGRTIETPVQNMALLPTVTELLGYDIEGGEYPDKSLLDPSTDPLRISCYHEDRCLAQIDGSMKYIHHFGNRADEYFDLVADPGETNNIINTLSKAEMSAKKHDLLRWQSEVRAAYLAKKAAR